MADLKIAIIGAGPAGLTLARILYINGIQAKVFERDASPDVRAQGGSLDLHEDFGQIALKRANLYEEWAQEIARPAGMDFRCIDKHGNTHLVVRDTDFGRPESDRHLLRDLLRKSLPDGMIQYGFNLRSVERGTLHFAHGTETGYDLIVGADGAWSKIRPAVHSHVPFYSSVTMIQLTLSDLANKHPKLDNLVGKGSLFAIGGDDGKAILCQRQGDNSVLAYAAKQTHETWSQELAKKGPEEVRTTLLHDYQSTGWDSYVLDLIRYSDDHYAPRSIVMMPPGLRWNTAPGFALIGDAAHVSSPFAGEGVNLAMWDSMTLASSILEHQDDLAAGVKEFEQKMFVRAKESNDRSWSRLNDRFTAGGAEKFSADFKAMIAKVEATNQDKEVVAPGEPKWGVGKG